MTPPPRLRSAYILCFSPRPDLVDSLDRLSLQLDVGFMYYPSAPPLVSTIILSVQADADDVDSPDDMRFYVRDDEFSYDWLCDVLLLGRESVYDYVDIVPDSTAS